MDIPQSVKKTKSEDSDILKYLSDELTAAKNTVISPDILVWKFCGKTQFPQSLVRIAQNYAEIVPFHKIFTPGNQVKLRYFCSDHFGKLRALTVFFLLLLF